VKSGSHKLAERFDRVAQAQHLSASKFHQKAGSHFADELEAISLTDEINAALADIGPQPKVDSAPPYALIDAGSREW